MACRSTSVPGETLAVVGESGSGKSVTALSILRLIPQPPGRIVGGRIMFKGRNLLELSDAEMRAIRGKEISMIFQEPMTSLNPVYYVRRADHRNAGRTRGTRSPCGPQGRDRHAGARRHSGGAAARRRISAPDVRRHAPARDDRDGARLPARQCSSPTSRRRRSTSRSRRRSSSC